MKTIRITAFEQIQNRYFEQMLEVKAYRLLGIFWTTYVEWYKCPLTKDIVFRYK